MKKIIYYRSPINSTRKLLVTVLFHKKQPEFCKIRPLPKEMGRQYFSANKTNSSENNY